MKEHQTFYFSVNRVQNATSPNDLPAIAGDISSNDSSSVAFQKLAQKKETFLNQNATPDFAARSVTLRKLKTPIDELGEIQQGLLYFDSNNREWSIMNVNGFNFRDDLNPGDDVPLTTFLRSSIMLETSTLLTKMARI